VFDITNV